MTAKKNTVVRTSISLPADIKRRMDKVKEPVNWSALACRAFEKELADIASRKEKKTMDDVKDRLRASLREDEEQMYQDGFSFGENWARESADAGQLKRLTRSREQTGSDWEAIFQNGLNDMYAGVAEFVEPEWPAVEFWNSVFGDDDVKHGHLTDDVDWLRGFADGAIDVWRSVEAEL